MSGRRGGARGPARQRGSRGPARQRVPASERGAPRRARPGASAPSPRRDATSVGSAAAPDPFTNPSTAALVVNALREDLGRGDVTTAALVPAGERGSAALVAREACVVAGLPLAEVVLRSLVAPGETATIELVAEEGERVEAGATLARIEAPVRALLGGERVLLNLVQRLSGVATLTRRYVDAVHGTRAQILDTRKTTPGLRLLEKYAVRVGGGRNHRFGLDDGVLIKDNHVAACGSVAVAVARARAAVPHVLRVEVECDSIEQVREAIAAGAELVLLDNMSPARVRTACREIAGRALVEVSGGVTLDSVRRYAEAGADMISVGRLTHSAPAVDIGLDWLAAPRARRHALPGSASRRGA